MYRYKECPKSLFSEIMLSSRKTLLYLQSASTTKWQLGATAIVAHLKTHYLSSKHQFKNVYTKFLTCISTVKFHRGLFFLLKTWEDFLLHNLPGCSPYGKITRGLLGPLNWSIATNPYWKFLIGKSAHNAPETESASIPLWDHTS
jgi:hypothetical protein